MYNTGSRIQRYPTKPTEMGLYRYIFARANISFFDPCPNLVVGSKNGIFVRRRTIIGLIIIELCTGAGVPELRYILLEPEPELENSSKNCGRQNYEKLILMQIAVLPPIRYVLSKIPYCLLWLRFFDAKIR